MNHAAAAATAVIVLFCVASPNFAAPASAPATAPAAATTGPATRATFADSDRKLSVAPPAGWTKQGMPAGAPGLLLVGPKRAAGKNAQAFRVQIFSPVEGAPAPTGTLDDFVAEVIPNITQKPAKETKVEKTTVDGVDARRFTVAIDLGKDETVKILNVVADQGPQTFILAYVDDQRTFDDAEAQAIVDSVRWNAQQQSKQQKQQKEPAKP
jgi:hypothetical protein